MERFVTGLLCPYVVETRGISEKVTE